jgi:hypothetical protein
MSEAGTIIIIVILSWMVGTAMAFILAAYIIIKEMYFDDPPLRP